jgi:hypothetical protein
MQPAPSGSVRYIGVLDYGIATELPGRALGVHQAAVVRVQEGLACDHFANSPCTHHCVVVLCSAIDGWVVSHSHQRRRAALGFTSVAVAFASACGGAKRAG